MKPFPAYNSGAEAVVMPQSVAKCLKTSMAMVYKMQADGDSPVERATTQSQGIEKILNVLIDIPQFGA